MDVNFCDMKIHFNEDSINSERVKYRVGVGVLFVG